MVSESTARLVEQRRHVCGDRSSCTSRARRSGPSAAAARHRHRAANRSGRADLRRARLGDGRSQRHCWTGRSPATGCVVGVVGPPGIGKSRIVREITVARPRQGRRRLRHLLRIAHHRRCHFMPPRVCCGPSRDPLVLMTPPHGRRCGAVLGHRRRGSRPPGRSAGHRRSRGFVASDRSGRSAASAVAMVNAAALARTDTDCLRHRGRTLDRRDQRVDAGGVPHRRSADADARPHHLPTGIRWRACACAPVTDDRPGAAGRFADVDVGH